MAYEEKLMNISRLHMVLGVIALVLIGVYVLLRTTHTKAYGDRVFSLQRNEVIRTIAIENNYGSFQFALGDSVAVGQKEFFDGKVNDSVTQELWVVVQPEIAKMSQQKALLMTDFLENLIIRRVLDHALSEYGLEDPAIIVTFSTSKGNEYHLAIGNSTVSQNHYYATNNDAVYLIDAGVVAQFDASMAAFRDRNIFSIDTKDITEIVYAPKLATPFTLERNHDNWYITKPFTAGAREIEIQEFLASFREITIADYLSADIDFATVGIDTTSESLTITNQQGESQQFRFGEATDTYRYVETQGFVYKVYAVDLNLDVLHPDTLIFEAPLKYPIDQVASFTLTLFQTHENPEVRYHFTKVPSGTSASGEGGNQYFMNDLPISEEVYTKVYVKYMSLLADGYKEFQPQEYPKVAQCRTELQDGTIITVHLYEHTAETFYMGFGKNSSYIMDKKRLDNLLYWILRAEELHKTASEPFRKVLPCGLKSLKIFKHSLAV